MGCQALQYSWIKVRFQEVSAAWTEDKNKKNSSTGGRGKGREEGFYNPF